MRFREAVCHCGIGRAHAELKLGALRDHVVGVTGLQHALRSPRRSAADHATPPSAAPSPAGGGHHGSAALCGTPP